MRPSRKTIAAGVTALALVIGITPIASATSNPARALLVSKNTDLSDPARLAGATVQGTVYVSLRRENVASVSFLLDGTAITSEARSAIIDTAKLTDGRHSVRAIVKTNSDRTRIFSARFRVKNTDQGAGIDLTPGTGPPTSTTATPSTNAPSTTTTMPPSTTTTTAKPSPATTVKPAPATTAPTVPVTPTPATGAIWKPAAGTTWQWQLSGNPDLSVNVGAYDIDWESTSAATVAAIHAKGAKAICYVDIGAVEPGRPDAGKFPASVQGKILAGWGESLLDVRQVSTLVPIQAARFKICKDKGFDGVELDVDEGFAENTGFPLTMDDQIRYNTALIAEVHKLGLAAGLKNGIYNDNPEMFIAAMEPITEYVIIEECAQAGDCSLLSPYIKHNKAVFHAEYIEDWNVTKTNYQPAMNKFCATTKTQLGFSSVLTVTNLTGWRVACP